MKALLQKRACLSFLPGNIIEIIMSKNLNEAAMAGNDDEVLFRLNLGEFDFCQKI